MVTCGSYLDRTAICLSDVWVGVDMRLNTDKMLVRMVWTPRSEFLHCSNSIVNIIWGTCTIIKEKENLHSSNERDIRTSSKNMERNGYGLNWIC